MKFLFNLKQIKNNLIIIAFIVIMTFFLTKVGVEHPFLTITLLFLFTIIYYYFYKLFNALEISQEYLKTVFDTQESIILITNGKYITDANRAFFNFFGYESVAEFRKEYDCVCELFENLNGKKVIDKKIDNQIWVDYVVANPHLTHKVLIKRGSKNYFFKLNAKNINFDMDRQKLVVLSDISELLSYQNHLEDKVLNEIEKRMKQEQLLVQQSKMASMGEMIGAIAHQWRQPLNALAIIIQSIRDDYENSELNQKEIDTIVNDSMKQIEFMSNTLNEFRSFYRPDKTKVIFDISKALRESIFIISSQLERAFIEIEIVGESFEVRGYPNEFKQVILNLISNSKDAIISKKIKHGKIKIELLADEKTIKISDNGGGVKSEIIDKIFEPYFTTKGMYGTGIGLYISKVIIEDNLNAKISFKNIKDGTQFLIKF